MRVLFAAVGMIIILDIIIVMILVNTRMHYDPPMKKLKLLIALMDAPEFWVIPEKEADFEKFCLDNSHTKQDRMFVDFIITWARLIEKSTSNGVVSQEEVRRCRHLAGGGDLPKETIEKAKEVLKTFWNFPCQLIILN